MNNQSKNQTCQNCKSNFIIEPEDFDFYGKIHVPPPTFCPECRMIRRLAYREERALYKDTCDMCHKNIISLFSSNLHAPVYCSDCWWSDRWDATLYGAPYDFSKPFFEQFRILQKKIPTQATNKRNSTGCEYCHAMIRSKNCYLTFGGFEAVDCYYCDSPLLSRNSLDSDVIINADRVYETVNSGAVFDTKFVYFSNDCLESSFLFDCSGCSNCFGCINLKNKKHHIFNKQYSKQDYQEKLKEFDIGSFTKLQEIEEKFWQLYRTIPRRYAFIKNAVNITGDDIENTKNCQTCFATRQGVENCKYVFLAGLLLKDSYDVGRGGDNSELLYEVTGSTQSQNSFFIRASNNVVDTEYSEHIYTGSHLFGCTKLRNKKYCILNKQYTKEEYEILIPKIKQHMMDMPFIDKKGRVYTYGEFFPTEHSWWAYNETSAHHWFPLTKEQSLEKGYAWRDSEPKDYNVTIESQNLPDHIKDVPDNIIHEIISCAHAKKNDAGNYVSHCNEQCTTAFRILPDELNFYRSVNIALPRLCPNCRFYGRLAKKNPPKLWKRTCMCSGSRSENGVYANTCIHEHGENPCTHEFQTAISPDRSEIVYCEKCYQSEFI